MKFADKLKEQEELCRRGAKGPWKEQSTIVAFNTAADTWKEAREMFENWRTQHPQPRKRNDR